MKVIKEYNDFIKKKSQPVIETGFEVDKSALNPLLFEWQKDIVRWAVKKGRAALFENCGLGKTLQSLEWGKLVSQHTNRPVLIVAPLAVAEQTKREGIKFGYDVTVCRSQSDVRQGLNVCNYEILEHFSADVFGGVVLDESSILKNYAGKIRNQIIEMFKNTPFKLSCTATPAPNDYMEHGNQSEFLGIMSRLEMLAMFFTHDGGETSKWRLKGHAQKKFWEWMASWAVVLTSPSDLGYSDDGYNLPKKNTHEHIVCVDGFSLTDEITFFTQQASTLTERRLSRKASLTERCKMAADLVAEKPNEQWVVWCDYNDESETLSKLIPNSKEVKGSDSNEYKANTLESFSNGMLDVIVSKPSIAGFGLNWQNCHNMIFVGLSDSFEMMYQAIRRCWRYGQKHETDIHIITSDTDENVRLNIERKENQAQEMMKEMVLHTQDILKKHIRGTTTEKINYNPQIEIEIPEWLGGIKDESLESA